MITAAPAESAAFSAGICLSLQPSESQLPVSIVEPNRFVVARPRRPDACGAILVNSVNGEPQRVPIRHLASDVPVREFAHTLR